ncbi:hypothetical protein BTDUT50_02885 [Neobacillus thermocopriae]|nr:hypothetical protein BTDUT50_02885 [Neobacillus thermocopriae]
MNKYAIATFIFIVGGLIYVQVVGRGQAKEFINDYARYEQAIEAIKEENGKLAIQLLNPLLEKYPNRYLLLHYLGLAYAIDNDFERAVSYYDKALQQRPFLQVDPIFTLQFGEILYFKGDYAKAKVFLERSKQLNGSEPFHERIEQLLATINTQ